MCSRDGRPRDRGGARDGGAGVASITYALVPDEELGSVDSRGWLADLGRRTDVCLALEAGLVDGA
ncbi:hypothetical protein GS448_21240 [Rhodococcus hoagii]|nr:hypothetical protein [Prescottella equi]